MEFTLPKYRHIIRTFLSLQEPWHLNVLRHLEGLIDDDDSYPPTYDLYRESLGDFLHAFQVYAQDQQDCANAEQLNEVIGETRNLLFATEDEAFRKILDNNSIDPLDIYTDYTLEFFDRFTQEFNHFHNSLSEEEEHKEENLLKWFEEFNSEKNFEKKSELFSKFFHFFEDELKYDTTICKCMLWTKKRFFINKSKDKIYAMYMNT